MTTQPTSTRSSSLPTILTSIGAILVALAAFLWFLGPRLFVDPYFENAPEVTDEDMYFETVQSGQPVDLPGEFEMTIMPQWVWNDPAFIESMSSPSGAMELPEFSCTTTFPDGATSTGAVDQNMMGVLLVTTEPGQYTIECDQGGMLEVSGQSAALNAGFNTANRNINLINWGTFASLVLGLAALLPGVYLLGARNARRQQLEQAAFAEAAPVRAPASGLSFMDGNGAPEGSSSLERTSAASPDLPPSIGRVPPAASNGAASEPSTTAQSFDPNAPHNSGSFEVRPRDQRPKPRSKDPFAED